MASPPQSYEKDWERINAKSWELPNYGPSPGFYRSKIYTHDHDYDYPEDGRLDSNDSTVPEEVKTDPHRQHLIIPAASRSIPDIASVPTRSNLTSFGSSDTYGRPQIPSQQDRATTKSLQHRAQSSTVALRQSDTPSKAKWRNGFRPDASFRLPYECRVFQSKMREEMQEDAFKSDFCQKIIQDTGAYVRISVGNAKLVHIWGQKSQVSAAQRQLQEILNNMMNQRALSSASRWDKIRAHSNTKDANAQWRESYEERVSSLRKPPEISTFYTLAFLWPSDGPSVNYCITTRRDFLDLIRLKYDVNIYVKSGVPDSLFVSGNSQRDISIIASQFRELWQSLMVQCETEIKLFLIGPPPIELMRTHIILQKSGQFSRAVLCGPELAPDVAATWKATADGLKLSNKTVVTSRLRNALHIIPQFLGFLQMRVKFGSFALQQWRRPKDGTSYRFMEFREMVSLQNTEGRLLPGIRLQQETMFDRIMASSILKPYGHAKIGSLTKLMPTYSANFEYKASHDRMIRMEAKFSLPPGSQEFEVNGIWCFKPQVIGAPIDRQMPMQISMVDFERSDWQFEIKALELCPESDISPELDKFKRSIAFQWNSNAKSIESAPQRKAKFAHGSQVTRFVEKAAIQLQVQRTPYIFEISRFDEYKYVAGHWSTIPNVSWGASLFDPSWDNLLGEQAESNIHNFPKDGSLAIFFPSTESDQEEKESKPTEEKDREAHHETEAKLQAEEKQLSNFMSIVQQIARMLGDPSAEMPDVFDSDLGTLF